MVKGEDLEAQSSLFLTCLYKASLIHTVMQMDNIGMMTTVAKKS